MNVTHVVLLDQTHELDPTLIHSASLALNSQVNQHLTQYWTGINADVSYAPALGSLPRGAWPVFLVKSLPPGEGGFHLDQHNQPYAKVIASPQDETWTIDASHEIIEMLIDPFGNRMQSSQAIQISGGDVVDAPDTFSYLVEACDPCEANNFAYEIGGIAVSDFITPHFYDASATKSTNYSFKGNITRPRQLLPGGYISYIRADGAVQQILWVDPSQPPQYKDLSLGANVRSLRERVHTEMGADLDHLKHACRRDPSTLGATLASRVAEHRKSIDKQRDRALVLMARYALE